MQNYNITYDDLRRRQSATDRRREMARALMASGGAPRDIGSGIHAATRAITAGLLNRHANREDAATQEMEAAARQASAERTSSALAGLLAGGGGQQASAAPAPSYGPSGVDAFNEKLAGYESGGDYSAVNDEGYTGRYQIGEARLADYNKAAGTNLTLAQLRADPALQEAVQRWHVGDIDKFIGSEGLDQFIGKQIGGTVITHDGIRAMAHLGGKEGARKFLASGGRYNPHDSNETHLSAYAANFAGSAKAPQAAPEQPQAGGVDPALLAVLQDPFADDASKALATMAIERQMAVPGEKTRVISGPEAAAMGLDPEGAYNVKPDGSVSKIGGGGVEVNVGGEGMKLTEGQSKDLGYYARGLYANDDLAAVESELTNLPATILDGFAGSVGNFFQDSDYQQARAAAAQFLSVILRKDTGAAITAQEFDIYGPMFLPMPGDGPEVMQQKRESRARALRAIRLGLGTATPLADKIDTDFAARETQTPPAMPQTAAPATPQPQQQAAPQTAAPQGEAPLPPPPANWTGTPEAWAEAARRYRQKQGAGQ